jgi:hypothetical protein
MGTSSSTGGATRLTVDAGVEYMTGGLVDETVPLRPGMTGHEGTEAVKVVVRPSSRRWRPAARAPPLADAHRRAGDAEHALRVAHEAVDLTRREVRPSSNASPCSFEAAC